MPVTFSRLNIINKIPSALRTSSVNRCAPKLSSQKVMVDCFKPTYYHTASLSDILNEIYGIYSLEDIEKITEMKKSYSALDEKELYSLQQTGIKSYLDNVKSKLGLEPADKCEKMYSFNPLNLTPEYQSEIKSEQLKLVAIKQAIKKDNPEISWIPYNKWFDSNIGIPSYKPAKSIYEHPCDKILRYTGTLNSKDIEEVNDLVKTYENNSLFQIFEKKSKLLEKMQQYFNDKNSDLIGQYSDRELAEMKELVKKYTALNTIQVNSGYFSKHLETLLNSSINKFEPNEYIEGIGLITDNIKINGIKGIISFISRSNEYMLRLYDKSILELKNDFLNLIPQTICLDELNDINKKAKDIINIEPKALISEIRFRIMDKNAIETFFESRKENKNTISEIMGKSKYSYFIMNFRNFYKGKYPSTGKLIASKLLKLLKDTDSKPLFLIATPYESTHSPVSMYLRMGFKPLFKTENEVYAEMSDHCEYMNKEPLSMYIENIDILSDKIDKLAQVYFPNTQ